MFARGHTGEVDFRRDIDQRRSARAIRGGITIGPGNAADELSGEKPSAPGDSDAARLMKALRDGDISNGLVTAQPKSIDGRGPVARHNPVDVCGA